MLKWAQKRPDKERWAQDALNGSKRGRGGVASGPESKGGTLNKNFTCFWGLKSQEIEGKTSIFILKIDYFYN